MKIQVLTAIALIATAALIGACGDDDETPTNPGPTCSGQVSVEDNRFVPATLTVSVGDSVTWCFNGRNIHTVTEGTLGNPTPLFDSGNKNSGSFGYRFTSAGTFPYHCIPHFAQGMTGTVTVQP